MCHRRLGVGGADAVFLELAHMVDALQKVVDLVDLKVP